MNTLHTVNKTGQPLTLCLKALKPGDGILLLEEGAYCLLKNKNELSNLKSVYVIEADIAARSIGLPNNITPVSFDRFVELSTQYQKVVSWF